MRSLTDILPRPRLEDKSGTQGDQRQQAHDADQSVHRPVARRTRQGLQEGVDELHAALGLFLVGARVGAEVAGDALHQRLDPTTSVAGSGDPGEVLSRAQRRLLRFEQRRRSWAIVPLLVICVTWGGGAGRWGTARRGKQGA